MVLRLVEPVHPADGFGFGGKVKGFAGGRLDAGSERVTADAGIKVTVARMLREVIAVEIVEEIKLALLAAAGEVSRRIEIQNVGSHGTNHGALINGRQPAGCPVFVIHQGRTGRTGEGKVGGQVLGFTAKPVTEPRSEVGRPGVMRPLWRAYMDCP